MADGTREISPHTFEQGPDDTYRLCIECGMWPDHHNHRRSDHRRNYCVCADCYKDPYDLPRTTTAGDEYDQSAWREYMSARNDAWNDRDGWLYE